MPICEWCGSENAIDSSNTVFWELPDGMKTIGITETPCVCCDDCGMEYQTEETVKGIISCFLSIQSSWRSS